MRYKNKTQLSLAAPNRMLHENPPFPLARPRHNFYPNSLDFLSFFFFIQILSNFFLSPSNFQTSFSSLIFLRLRLNDCCLMQNEFIFNDNFFRHGSGIRSRNLFSQRRRFSPNQPSPDQSIDQTRRPVLRQKDEWTTNLLRRLIHISPLMRFVVGSKCCLP